MEDQTSLTLRLYRQGDRVSSSVQARKEGGMTEGNTPKTFSLPRKFQVAIALTQFHTPRPCKNISPPWKPPRLLQYLDQLWACFCNVHPSALIKDVWPAILLKDLINTATTFLHEMYINFIKGQRRADLRGDYSSVMHKYIQTKIQGQKKSVMMKCST